MKHLHFLAFVLCWLVWGHLLKAQSLDNYSSLEPSQPIEFKGNCLRYADKEIILGPKTFFVDGQLSDREVAGNPYVSLNPQLHSRSATYIKRNGLLIRKITIKSSRPFQCAYHPLTP